MTSSTFSNVFISIPKVKCNANKKKTLYVDTVLRNDDCLVGLPNECHCVV